EDDITGGLTVPDASFVSNWIKRSASWVVQADKKTEHPKVLVDNSSTQKPTAEEQPTQTTQMVTAPKTIAREPEETTASQRTIIVPKPVNNEPVARNSEWPKTYVVTKGDNLAVIAKKFYGEELGNTRANIDILFKANTTTLESPDKIKVGQKLIIPLVPDLTQSAPQPANVFPKSLVETVPANKVDRIPPRNALIRVSDRYYVAKDGDSLWSIAAKELGKGTRYNEIFTLNSDIMKDPGNVVPGMRLKMPSQ
ncbi:MAG: LysM peptidoglycan-binding domain-containing protein, partial [Sedimentisphaerales bacterium]|nr:LysM peptidoglycan-binding domain-containing protein [Sedimentisphaerales bacterium]